MRSPCCLGVYLFPYQLLIRWAWYVYYVTWAHPNSVLHKYQSVCIYIYIPLSLLGKGSVKTLPRERKHEIIEVLDALYSMRSVSCQRIWAIRSSQNLSFYLECPGSDLKEVEWERVVWTQLCFLDTVMNNSLRAGGQHINDMFPECHHIGKCFKSKYRL
jgi:hypothetical protein